MSQSERLKCWREYNLERQRYAAYCREAYADGKKWPNQDDVQREYDKVLAAEQRLIAAERAE